MPTAYLYSFSDACPSDWLVHGHDEVWHTIVNFLFQPNPPLGFLIDAGRSHEEVLPLDHLYVKFIDRILVKLPNGRLRKWKSRGNAHNYRERFCRAFAAAQSEFNPLVSACSFQEKTLRSSKRALIASYNKRIGGIEGMGIGFHESLDEKGRQYMKHSFLNFYGKHEIHGIENQILVLLFMAWFVADQYGFYLRDFVKSGLYGFDKLHLTIVSDKLSGDDEFRRKSENNLRYLIDPENDGAPLALVRSQKSDTFTGDLLADNLAGWLTAAINNPLGTFAGYARDLIPSGVWTGWYLLQPSISKIEFLSAIERLTSNGT